MASHASGRRLARRACAALQLALALAGCATYQAWDGPRPDAGVATIQADPRISAGLPMTVSIRQVDARTVGPQFATVAVAAGRHRLLVDCTMAEGHVTSRHELQVEVEPGGHYRLAAESAAGNRSCGEVRLEPR